MRKNLKGKIAVFIIGLLAVSLLTALGSLAFFGPNLLVFIRNVIATDAAFIILFAVWVNLHKDYELMYKSSLEHEEEK